MVDQKSEIVYPNKTDEVHQKHEIVYQKMK